MNIDKRISAFSQLGSYLKRLGSGEKSPVSETNNPYYDKLVNVVNDSYLYNGWFIEENVKHMLLSLGNSIEKSKLEEWVSRYGESINNVIEPKTVAVIMAGNIPVVGFHDFLSVLISGNRILVKMSSDDNKLLPAIAELLISIEQEFSDFIKFTDEKLKGFDAVIATGSGNTTRYFDFYFGKYKNIIRSNRNGVAVLNGKESEEDLEALANDIFMYFGLGCRNVSKIFLPEGFDFIPMLDVFAKRKDISLMSKYFNNYEYNKAIFLVNSRKHYDTDNALYVEDKAYASAVSVLHYEYYSDINELNNKFKMDSNDIQCVVSSEDKIENKLDFGQSQQPQLWDYADGVDTLEFLLNLD